MKGGRKAPTFAFNHPPAGDKGEKIFDFLPLAIGYPKKPLALGVAYGAVAMQQPHVFLPQGQRGNEKNGSFAQKREKESAWMKALSGLLHYILGKLSKKKTAFFT